MPPGKREGKSIICEQSKNRVLGADPGSYSYLRRENLIT